MGCVFQGSSLQRTYFEDAHLKEVNFCNMTFSGDICFNKADLSKADFENVQGYGGLSFVEAVMWEASFKGANLSRANFKKTQFSFANFEKARLQDANFENAQGRYGCFREADLWGASFKEGDLAGSCFDGAHMRAANLQRTQLIDWQPEEGYPKGCSFIRANLMGAQLSGSDFRYQDLRGAMLRYITFDSQTFFEYCGIDDKTDFTMVNLDSANIHPSLLTTLKVNIRRSTWEDYFKKNKGLFALFMKFFWWISDYGSSTKRILCVFFTTAFFFALLYGCLDIIYPGILKGISPKTHCAMWLSQIIAFSLATMVTLGFGGININFVIDFPKASVFANVLVVCNLLSGYFLLAVLVTRIGFLFGTLAPELDINVQSDQE